MKDGLLGRARSAGWLALLIFACDGGAPPAEPACREDKDCLGGQVCLGGVCISGDDGSRLDAGVIADALADVGLADSHLADAELDASPMDATPTDATPMDATSIDAGPSDTGFIPTLPTDSGPSDGQSDTGPSDSGTPDSGASPDATFPDAASGDIGPVQPGNYGHRRILTPGIPSTTELVALAISPDDTTLLLGARYDRLYVFDIAADSSTVSAPLPKDATEPIRINAIAYGPGGGYALIATTALIGMQNTPESRLFRAGRRGQSPILVGNRIPGEWLESIAVDEATGEIFTLSRRDVAGSYTATLRRYDDAARTHTFVASTPVSAGCQDLAIADDGLGGRGLVLSCGVNGGAVGVYDSTGAFSFGAQPGNTSRIAARPQRDYALAISWSGGRLARFEQGVWTSGFGAPSVGNSAWGIAFSDDGRRALITGQYTGTVGFLMEYRHDLYATADLTDVSILNFNLGPWLGTNGVILSDAAFRPGSDCGFIVGGCSSIGCTRGYLIAFEVTNGRPCP